jgi:hypothetical protein
MAKRQGQVARALWSGGLLVGIAFVVWLVLLAAASRGVVELRASS